MQDALLQGMALGAALVSTKTSLPMVRLLDELSFDDEARELWKILGTQNEDKLKEKLKEWFAARGVVAKENRAIVEGVIDEVGRRGRERTLAERKRMEELERVLEEGKKRCKLMLSKDEVVQWLVEQIEGKAVAGKVGEVG